MLVSVTKSFSVFGFGRKRRTGCATSEVSSSSLVGAELPSGAGSLGLTIHITAPAHIRC